MPHGSHHRSQSSHSQSYSQTSGSSNGSPKLGSNTKWLSGVKSWLSTSEPSAQAMKKQRKDEYKKHGVSRNDPMAAEKLHLPMGKVPQGATTSTSGPTPEEILIKERKQRPAYMKHIRSAQSVSSGGSSGPNSLKETNVVAPWDD